MKTKIVIPVMIVMVMTMAGTAMARGGGQSGFHRGQNQIFEQLTPEKQVEVKSIFKKYEDKFESIKSQMWAKRTELNALVESGNAEKKDITSLVAEMAKLRTDGYNLRKQVSSEIEKTTGIAMPSVGFGGYGMNNGKQGRGKHRENHRDSGGCWN